MDHLSYKTISANKKTVTKEWVIVDAAGIPLGRLASQVAKVLMGKNKTNYTPNVDCGDNVIVINSDEIKLTGKKWTDKLYIRHTGYPGGQRQINPRDLKEKRGSEIIIQKAVKGMLPKSRLGRQILSNLHVYAKAEHPHEAQKPKEIELIY